MSWRKSMWRWWNWCSADAKNICEKKCWKAQKRLLPRATVYILYMCVLKNDRKINIWMPDAFHTGILYSKRYGKRCFLWYMWVSITYMDALNILLYLLAVHGRNPVSRLRYLNPDQTQQKWVWFWSSMSTGACGIFDVQFSRDQTASHLVTPNGDFARILGPSMTNRPTFWWFGKMSCYLPR